MESQANSSIIEKARRSHEHNRRVFHINPQNVELERLYGYRSQAIGAFTPAGRRIPDLSSGVVTQATTARNLYAC
jgi:hypothetical protein